MCIKYTLADYDKTPKILSLNIIKTFIKIFDTHQQFIPKNIASIVSASSILIVYNRQIFGKRWRYIIIYTNLYQSYSLCIKYLQSSERGSFCQHIEETIYGYSLMANNYSKSDHVLIIASIFTSYLAYYLIFYTIIDI